MGAIYKILDQLFETYSERVPDVNKIRQAMLKEGIINDYNDIENDHIAFRTLGVPNLGIASFEKIFLANGYMKRDYYSFKEKKLNAYWYSPPYEKLPRIFLSELKVNELSQQAQLIINKYTSTITSDPVEEINLNDAIAVSDFLHKPLWRLPELDDYDTLLKESEYAAWVIYNRYYLNHFTISVQSLSQPYNKLEFFNKFLQGIHIKLNDSGGIIKTSRDGLLRQSSTVAEMVEAVFHNKKQKLIAGSYVEFAERNPMPEFQHLSKEKLKREHLRDGFETSNADKIFESTFTKQTMK